MKIIKNVVLVFCIIFSLHSYAQKNVKINTKEIKDKEIVAEIKKSDSYFKLATIKGYRLAIEGYYKAYEYTQQNAELNYKLGICYLNANSIEKNKACLVLQKAFEINPNVADDIKYFIGYAKQLNGEFDQAIEEYQTFLNAQSELPEKERIDMPVTAEKRINECISAKKLIENPTRAWIDNAGENINSSFPDYAPVLPVDESFLLFTSRRDTTGGKKKNAIDENDNQYYEDIFVSYRNDSKVYEKALNLVRLNTKEHDAVISLSPDGQTLYTYKGEKEGTIYESKMENNEWTKPKKMKKINTKYQETSIALANDGKTLYFVSDRPKDDFGNQSIGGLDIFVMEKDENDKWGKVKNIGEPINTKYDEEAVYIHLDNTTLYFSSKREGAMGGYDIYKAEKNEDGSWNEPENIGYPINSVEDDIFFVSMTNPRYAYFSSDREGGLGNQDIYKITFLGPEKLMVPGTEDFLIASSNATIEQKVKQEEVEVKKVRLTIMKGTVTDALSQEPLEATIELLDTLTGEVVNSIQSNKTTGAYMLSFPSGSCYKFRVSSPTYITYSEIIDIPQSLAYQEVTKDFVLTKAGVGTKIVLKNIEFDFAKATLRPSSFPELDRLVKMLEAYPGMTIEISGHTDNIGTKAVNEKLSADRAESVLNYLVEKGIAKERLTFAGYADTQPIADNKTEEGRQQNRRVEIKVLTITQEK